jgi:hypothetical protein
VGSSLRAGITTEISGGTSVSSLNRIFSVA